MDDRESPRAPCLQGHAAVFNQLSEDLGGWRERFAPGAFAEALEGDVPALWNHRDDLELGRTSTGTLELWEDDVGLAFRVLLPETSWAEHLLLTVRRAGGMGASCYSRGLSDEWGVERGQKIRTILKVRELIDVAPGAKFPLWPQSRTEVAPRPTERRPRDSEEWRAALRTWRLELQRHRLQT